MADIIYEHTNIFLHSLLCGFGIWFLYDGLLMLRKTIKHGALLLGVEDMLFWLIAAVMIFSTLYSYNYGSLRGYVFLGIIIGIIVHVFCVTKPLLALYCAGLDKLKRILRKLIKNMSKMQKKD